MPFKKVNINDKIEKQKETDPAFRKSWDESREEYKKIGEENAKKNKYKCSTWDELERELFTPEEIAESKARAAIITEMIRAKVDN